MSNKPKKDTPTSDINYFELLQNAHLTAKNVPPENLNPRYDFWTRKNDWTLWEAAALIHGFEPLDCGGTQLKYISDTQLRQSYIDFTTIAMNELGHREIDWLGQYHNLKCHRQKWIGWAKSKHFTIPPALAEIIKQHEVTINQNVPKQHKAKLSYCTPDMELMHDAVEKFWKDYDLTKPDASKAPFKNSVVNWLMEEAKKRGIAGFSKSRADMMDTIIRCPVARQGGNSK